MDNISEHLDLTVFFDKLPPPPPSPTNCRLRHSFPSLSFINTAYAVPVLIGHSCDATKKMQKEGKSLKLRDEFRYQKTM